MAVSEWNERGQRCVDDSSSYCLIMICNSNIQQSTAAIGSGTQPHMGPPHLPRLISSSSSPLLSFYLLAAACLLPLHCMLMPNLLHLSMIFRPCLTSARHCSEHPPPISSHPTPSLPRSSDFPPLLTHTMRIFDAFTLPKGWPSSPPTSLFLFFFLPV